ncbi:MAG: helix-turn-helix domain-containing protein [Rhodospirillales bacterium]|nr:helix-turn-helix domain-containing protein [Rhodospirillales bacterium]
MPPRPSSSSNAERAARALLQLGQGGAEGVSLGDLALALAETKPGLHRSLTALAKFGFVEKRGRGRYRLGPAIFALAQLDSTLRDRLRQWRPLLVEMASRHGCTVYLVQRAGHDAVVLDMHVGSAPLQALTSGVGDRLPLGLGPGAAALLLPLDAATREAILAANAPAFAARGYAEAHVRGFVAETLARGYALDRAQFVAECGGIALPVRERNGEAPVAISVSAPVSFLTEARVADMAAELRRAIAAVTGVAAAEEL